MSTNAIELNVQLESTQITVHDMLEAYEKVFQVYKNYKDKTIPNVEAHVAYFEIPIVTLTTEIKEKILEYSEKVPLMLKEVELVSQAFLVNYEPLINAVNTDKADNIDKIGNELVSLCEKSQNNCLRYQKKLNVFERTAVYIKKESCYIKEAYNFHIKKLEEKEPSSFAEVYEKSKATDLANEDLVLLKDISNSAEHFDKIIKAIYYPTLFFHFFKNFIRLSMERPASSVPIIDSIKEGITANEEQGYAKKIEALAKQLPNDLEAIEAAISSRF